MHEQSKTITPQRFRVRLLLSYDGTDFCGWQSQATHKNKTSVQARLQAALSKIYKEEIHCVSSGRTDAGVHASSQNVHFTLSRDPRSVPLLLALRTLLPSTISVRKAWLIPEEFCVNRSAVAKTYRYHLYNGDVPSAILGRFTCWHPHPLDREKLQALADVIVGHHDFKTFQSAGGTPPKTSQRRVFQARWIQNKKNLFIFEITGNGFLRQMIRNLVSTQLELLAQGSGPEEMKRLLELRDRTRIGKPAPPEGLFMSKVYFPSKLTRQSLAFGGS